MYQINTKGDWIALKKKIIMAFPILSESDLKLDNGDEFYLLKRLQKKLFRTQKEVIVMINKL